MVKVKRSGKAKGKKIVKKVAKKVAKKNYNYRGVFIFFIVFFIVLFLLSLVFLFCMRNYVVDVYETNLTLKVGDYVGINLDTDKIHMGTVFPGGTATREVFISSESEGYYYITYSTNNLEDWIFISSQNKRLIANDNISVVFYALPPKDAAEGQYEEVIKVYVVKRKVSFITRHFLIKERPLMLLSERKIPSSSAEISINITR